ncbi:MAG: AAA family ATPase [Candidatus Rokuibacteriota bacterium]
MGTLADLQLLIQSGYALIGARTAEEDRLERLLDQVSANLKIPLWWWTVTEGLRKEATGDPATAGSAFARHEPGAAPDDTREPAKALGAMASLEDDGIFMMKDLHRYLDQVTIVRRLRDLAPRFTSDRRVIVLCAPALEIPAELRPITAPFTLDLPTADELRALTKRVGARLAREQQIRVALSDAEVDRLVERMRGLTEQEAERTLVRAAVRDRALTVDDVDVFIALRRELLQREGALEYVAPEENLAEVGGFRTLKAWLAKRRRAFEPAAREFGLSPPKGILLLGVQGCLRGDTRVLLADGRMPTLETLARQVTDCLEPGTYDVAYRVALEDGQAALASKLQIHADMETVLLTFADGRELEMTPDHEVRTTQGWKRADRLAVGDEVLRWNRAGSFATPPKRTGFDRPLHSVRLRRVPVDTLPATWSPELAEFVGLLAAEGNRDRYRITLTLSDDEEDLAQWLRERSEKLFGIRPAERSRAPKRVREFRFNSFDVAVNLHPLLEGTKRTKAVPDPLFSLDDTCVAGFVRALFEGDGTVANYNRGAANRRSPRVELKTVSPSMARGVQLLLQRLGIFSSIRTQTTVHGYSRYPVHTVQIQTRESLERFATLVGFITHRKQERLARGLATFSRRTKPRHSAAARVMSIETGRCLDRVYDLTVPGAERFIANGLVVHNCGKTLVARAVAREWSLPLLKMEAGRLYDKFIGESEKNLERVIQAAEAMAPCVLMVDEIEKALGATSSDADAGLARRLFGRLLGWLQDRKAAVFVVATSNDISALPPELTRKGRFDEIFFIDLPTPDERKEILSVHLARRKRQPKLFDLDNLAAALEGFSGAEIEQAIVSALYTAFTRGVELSTQIVYEEIKATRPLSVTRREEIDTLRAWARDRTVSAS